MKRNWTNVSKMAMAISTSDCAAELPRLNATKPSWYALYTKICVASPGPPRVTEWMTPNVSNSEYVRFITARKNVTGDKTGKVIDQNRRNDEAPSTMAASSRLSGTSPYVGWNKNIHIIPATGGATP